MNIKSKDSSFSPNCVIMRREGSTDEIQLVCFPMAVTQMPLKKEKES